MTIVAKAGVAFYKCYIHPSIYSRLEEWSWRSGAGGVELEEWSWRSAAGGVQLEECSWRSAAGGVQLEEWTHPPHCEDRPTVTRSLRVVTSIDSGRSNKVKPLTNEHL